MRNVKVLIIGCMGICFMFCIKCFIWKGIYIIGRLLVYW